MQRSHKVMGREWGEGHRGEARGSQGVTGEGPGGHRRGTRGSQGGARGHREGPGSHRGGARGSQGRGQGVTGERPGGNRGEARGQGQKDASSEAGRRSQQWWEEIKRKGVA